MTKLPRLYMVRKSTFDQSPMWYLNPELLRWKGGKDCYSTNCQRRRSNQTFVFSYSHQCWLWNLTRSFQGNNYERAFTNGFPHRTHQKTITLHVVLITRRQQTGFSKAKYTRNGSQQIHFSGSTENVRSIPPPSGGPLMITCNCSWIR
jgi:hypothetical protein